MTKNYFETPCVENQAYNDIGVSLLSDNNIPSIGKPRLSYIDNLRVLACFLVLLTHSTMPSTNPEKEGFWMFGLSALGSPS